MKWTEILRRKTTQMIAKFEKITQKITQLIVFEINLNLIKSFNWASLSLCCEYVPIALNSLVHACFGHFEQIAIITYRA